MRFEDECPPDVRNLDDLVHWLFEGDPGPSEVMYDLKRQMESVIEQVRPFANPELLGALEAICTHLDLARRIIDVEINTNPHYRKTRGPSLRSVLGTEDQP